MTRSARAEASTATRPAEPVSTRWVTKTSGYLAFQTRMIASRRAWRSPRTTCRSSAEAGVAGFPGPRLVPDVQGGQAGGVALGGRECEVDQLLAGLVDVEQDQDLVLGGPGLAPDDDDRAARVGQDAQ